MRWISWARPVPNPSAPASIAGPAVKWILCEGRPLAPGGQSFLACYSTTKDDAVSKITSQLTPGAHVTCSKSDIDCVVTEYGVAELRGKSAAQRTKSLIAIAHPKYRDKLLSEAKAMNLMV